VYKKYDAFVVILLHRYVCKIMAGVTFSQMHDQWLLYLQDQVGSFLSGCLMQLAKYTIHNHCLFRLSATMVTTLWLKQPIVSCSAHISLQKQLKWLF